MYTCGFLINAKLVKEASFRTKVKLVKEDLISTLTLEISPFFSSRHQYDGKVNLQSFFTHTNVIILNFTYPFKSPPSENISGSMISYTQSHIKSDQPGSLVFRRFLGQLSTDFYEIL